MPDNYAINDELTESIVFSLEHLNREEKQQITQVLLEYSDIQYREGENLTITSTIKHTIQTKYDDPIYKKPYKYPQAFGNEVNNQINEMLQQNIIQKSKSPYCSPIWIVPKKSDASGKQKYPLVIDYGSLNEITIDEKFPIPVMDEILDKLGRCQYFTTIDLAKGFHQIQMDQRSIAKTAFSTKYGHYEYTRMPFGLKNAPATFQRCMNNLLEELIYKDCLVYLDDIIVYSTSLEEHIMSIRKVFEKLRIANLKLQLDKCEFLKKETEFLGHIITTKGIKPNPNKINPIIKFPIPKTPKEIKSFLGLCGFYRKFIPNFAKIAKLMTLKLKKGASINIKDNNYPSAFEKLKLLIISDPILIYPNFERKFALTTDASNMCCNRCCIIPRSQTNLLRK